MSRFPQDTDFYMTTCSATGVVCRYATVRFRTIEERTCCGKADAVAFGTALCLLRNDFVFTAALPRRQHAIYCTRWWDKINMDFSIFKQWQLHV